MKQYFSDSNDQQILTIFKAKVTQNLTGRGVTSMITVKYKVLNLLLDWFCTEKLIQWYPTLNTLIRV